MSARDHLPAHVVVMGVSATGKSSVAEELALRTDAVLVEGDAHHPPSNLAKMAAGVPLTDEDRLPWLERLAEVVAEHHEAGTPTVLACSALRRSYRDLLRTAVPPGLMFFVHLHAPADLLRARMSGRRGHFMPETLLQSQLDTVERLDDDEAGAVVDVSGPLDEVVDAAEKAVRAWRGR